MTSTLLSRRRCAALWLLTLLGLLSCHRTFAWVQDEGGLWPDGSIEMHLQLGSTPTYSDSTNPNTSADAALDTWNQFMARVQFSGRLNSNVGRAWGNSRNNVTFGTKAAGEDLGDGVLAITMIDTDGTRRRETDVVVNSDEQWDSYRDYLRSDKTDIRRVLIHEFGHVLGLDHPDEAGQFVSAIMNAYVSNIDAPLQDDLDGIGALYGFTTANPGRPPILYYYSLYDKTVEVGQEINLSISGDGATPFTYQWYKDGQPIAGATEHLFSIPQCTKTDAGTYHVVVTNPVGSTTSDSVTITVNDPVPPTISSSPRNVNVVLGDNTSVYASASGSDPITVQWYHNDQPIPGATYSTYYLNHVTASDAGTYYMVATNVAGTATSGAWTVSVEPLPAPYFYNASYGQAVITVTPGERLSIIPHLRSDSNQTYQWYRDGEPLAGKTSRELYLPYATDLAGEYILVATNPTGSSTSPTYRVALGAATDTPVGGWTATTRSASTVYFLFENPARIERFDLATGTFLSAINLPRSATAFTVHDGYLYYSAGRTLRRVRVDGTGDEALSNVANDIASLFGFGRYLYARFTGSNTGAVTLNLDTFAANSTRGGYYAGSGFSPAPSLGRVFARTAGISPSDITYLTFNSDGTVDQIKDSPYHGDYPNASQTWVLNDEATVVDNSGTIYHTADLTFKGSIAAFLDLAEATDGTLFALRGSSIDRFGSNLVLRDSLPLEQPAHAMAATSDHLYVFRQPNGPGTNVTAEEVSLSDFAGPQPVAAVNPSTRDVYIDDVFQDVRGNLILHSRLARSLWIWSPSQQQFITNIPLFRGASHLTYLPNWDRIVVGYPDGLITAINPTDTQPRETFFARAPIQILGLAAAGDHLMLTDPSGAWVAYYTYDRDGTRLSRREWSWVSRVFTWNPVNHRIYHFRDDTSPNDLIYNEIKPDGTFGDTRDSPYHGGLSTKPPILVSPGGDQILLGNGVFYNADTLKESNALASDLETGVWLNGRLYTANLELSGTTITRWGGFNYLADATATVAGHAPHLFTTSDQNLLMVSQQNGQVVFSVFDADLNPVSRVTHRGGDLLGNAARLSNLSTRVSLTDSSDGLLVVGFVIAGNEPLKVLVRAIGPGLTQFGLGNVLPDPAIQLFNQQGERVAQNNDWTPNLIDLFTSLGAFALPPDSRDAALLVDLPPGAYTAQVARGNNDGGTVLLELYDASAASSSSRLVNLSTRMRSGGGEAVLTTGFVITGENESSLLMRAIGPGLTRFGVPGVLTDPVLTVHQEQETKATNDNWGGDAAIAAAATQVGAFELDSASSADSALLITLPPGAYTGQVTGAEEESSGTALIEVYQIDN